jgi:hypothetical protein
MYEGYSKQKMLRDPQMSTFLVVLFYQIGIHGNEVKAKLRDGPAGQIPRGANL